MTTTIIVIRILFAVAVAAVILGGLGLVFRNAPEGKEIPGVGFVRTKE